MLCSADEVQKIGNRTECAMLELISGLGADVGQEREAADILHLFPFSSDRKRMSSLVLPKKTRCEKCCCSNAHSVQV